MDRRHFLQLLAMTGIPTSELLNAATQSTLSAPHHLVLIELQGGNDGLNTVVPYADDNYYKLRPDIAIQRDKVLQLDERVGLHPALLPLESLWHSGHMAVINGVGYPQPNRSHFRSIEIWETGSAADETRVRGWLTPLAEQLPKRNSSGITAVALAPDQGPLAGANRNSVAFKNLKRFIRQSKKLAGTSAESTNKALLHILDVQKATRKAGLAFARTLDLPEPDRAASDEKQNNLSRDLDIVAQLMISNAGPQIFKAGFGSFDTHINQSARHHDLLQQLASAISDFKQTLSLAGIWDKTLVMTYSEFGRRVKENGSKGTDHGTAAPQFIFGGQVRGGLYGQQPSLDHLDNDDLMYNIDFRQIYATIVGDWLNLHTDSNHFSGFEKLRFIR